MTGYDEVVWDDRAKVVLKGASREEAIGVNMIVEDASSESQKKRKDFMRHVKCSGERGGLD